MRPTRMLVRLHIQQGYLAKARSLMEVLEREGRSLEDLRALWEAQAARVRREARIRTLKRLLRRLRRRRASPEGERGRH